MTQNAGDTLGSLSGLLMVVLGKVAGIITIGGIIQALVFGLVGGIGGWLAHRILNYIFKRKDKNKKQ